MVNVQTAEKHVSCVQFSLITVEQGSSWEKMEMLLVGSEG